MLNLDRILTISSDCGPKRFTPGQAERMHKLWKMLRAN